MSPRNKRITILALAITGVLAIGAALAVPSHMHRHGGPFDEMGFGGGIGRALASLDLTDEQKTRLKAIVNDEGPAMDPLVDDHLRSKKALFEAVHGETFDEKKVRAAATGAARAEAELAVERARLVSRFREVLTDEQKERLDSMRDRFEERMEHHLGMARTLWHEHAADFIDSL